MWRALRITVLLFILVVVGAGALHDRWHSTDWDRPLRVGLFPVSADSRPVTDAYIDSLGPERFAAIETFFEREARRHGLALTDPVNLTLHAPVDRLPPARSADAGMLGTILWSLRLRWYAWRTGSGSGAQIKLYVLYHDPAVSPAVPHSLGLQKGLIGVIHAFAAPQMDGQNNIVLAHELLHTVGASDKYDPATGLAVFPEGHGDPRSVPRYPQATAEIMAGRRMLSAREAQMPESLERVTIGEQTALEIQWR